MSTTSRALTTQSELLRLQRKGLLWALVLDPISIAEFWKRVVPVYESVNYGSMAVKLDWEPWYAQEIRKISSKRFINRCANYLDPTELARVRLKYNTKGEASIRFGNRKDGHGYSKERGDFCLVGGMVKGKDLTIFYRSLELIGGFAYDLTLIEALSQNLNIRWKTVTLYTCKAFVFALKGNSNQKLYPKLKGIFK
jgi:hypothetical protein